MPYLMHRLSLVAFTLVHAVTLRSGLAAAGDVNASFNPDITPGEDDAAIYGAALQADGRVVIAGDFPRVGASFIGNLARLQPDGAPDTTFTPGPDAAVYSVAVLPGGQILAGGAFASMNGCNEAGLARLTAAGDCDTAFMANLWNNFGFGGQPWIYSVTPLADSKVIAAGSFTAAGSQMRNNLARLNAGGSVDNGFTSGVGGGIFPAVRSTAEQADGKILVSGDFTLAATNTSPTSARNYFARFNADGTVDSFNPDADFGAETLLVQPDGKVLAGGWFTTVGGLSRPGLVRLNATGSVDTGFVPGIPVQSVQCIALQANGKILAGGNFEINGTIQPALVRFHPDGAFDSSFSPVVVAGFDGDTAITTAAIRADGQIIIGGYFTCAGAEELNSMALVMNDPATQSLTADGSTRVVWMRGGTSPEARRVTFELSTNGGTTWTPLGNGSRIPGGWELTGLNLPASGEIRARAVVGDGRRSTGIVETRQPLATPLQAWRSFHFGTSQNAGAAANDADNDHDGVVNLTEFAFGLHPLQPDAGRLPVAQLSGGFWTFRFTPPPGVGGIVYGAEWSPDLGAASWQPVTNTGTAPELLFQIPAGSAQRLFLRLTVTQIP